MISLFHQEIAKISTHPQKIHRVRELLQVITLSILSKQGFFQDHCFVGGTALRICHHLQRYSEDLDFSCKHKQAKGYDATRVDHLQQEITLLGLTIEVVTSPHAKAVFSASLKFSGLLKELGLSGHGDQKLQIKCEVDTNPPDGATWETIVINDTRLFAVHAYELPSLMAGKVHAILQRGFTKGRDRYDLVWYLSKGIVINMTLLKNALRQTGYPLPIKNRSDVVNALTEKLLTITTAQLLSDAGVFLEDTTQQALLDTQLIAGLLQKSKGTRKV